MSQSKRVDKYIEPYCSYPYTILILKIVDQLNYGCWLETNSFDRTETVCSFSMLSLSLCVFNLSVSHTSTLSHWHCHLVFVHSACLLSPALAHSVMITKAFERVLLCVRVRVSMKYRANNKKMRHMIFHLFKQCFFPFMHSSISYAHSILVHFFPFNF